MTRPVQTAVINAARSVSDRLDFLKTLQILVFDPESKKQLLERSQLHRVIAEHTWLFGEQFNLTNDDEDLTSVLKAHLQLLGKDRNELAQTEPVFDADGKARIVDLMLSQRLPTSTDEERKHLVIELKRPSQPINEDVINQIKKYAKAVALDDRFKNSSVEWDSQAFQPRGLRQRDQRDGPRRRQQLEPRPHRGTARATDEQARRRPL